MMISTTAARVIMLSTLSATIFARSISATTGRRSFVTSAFIGRHTPQLVPRKNSAHHVSSSSLCRSTRQLQRTTAFYNPASFSTLQMSTTTPTPTSSDTSTKLVGIDYVRSSIAEVLNEIFDPAEIAKGAAIAKLDGKKNKKQKKKKKKKPNNDDSNNEQPAAAKEEEPPPMSEEERTSIIQEAISNAKPFTIHDTMVTPATKAEFGDYQCNAAMSLSKSAGLNPRDCATKIVEALESKLDGVMEVPLEIAGPGFINLKFKDDYLCNALGEMANDCGGRLAVPVTE